ncbi:MAG: xanthine dehydrogenase molybdopterin binding subunit [Planctomycetota bacterium]
MLRDAAQPGRAVGQTIPHDSAVGHVTGTTDYIEDIPRREDELIVSFVGSPIAAGRLVRLDLEPARAIDGVVDLFTAADVPGERNFGLGLKDEPFLASDELLYLGQPMAVIAAENAEALAAARAAIEVETETTDPILTVDDARAQSRFIGPARQIVHGNVDAAMAQASHSLKGTFHSGGQEQFYLESQAALAFPDEDGQIVLHSSTQNTTQIQAVVAEILGLGQHEVVCICRRMGGAFGGKETQAAIPAIMAALVAARTSRAARLIYDKDLDMQVTGKRHEYASDWEVGFDDDGRIAAARFHFYSNGGAAADLSLSVMERTLMHAENAYFVENVEINGQVCFTNLPPNTAFRGFGGPQAIVSIENIIQEVAHHLGKDPLEVQRANLYGAAPRHVTPYGQVFEDNNLAAIIDQVVESSDYHARRAAILAEVAGTSPDPRQPHFRHQPLRGIALTPVKFGISFTNSSLNQGNALVNVYTDGTVQVSTGGTEMGQGLNTKIRQLVADEFGIDWHAVRVMATSTEKSNNTSPTAASAGTDLNGAAAVAACRQIKERLVAFVRESAEEESEEVLFADGQVGLTGTMERAVSFGELAQRAKFARVDLGARGFYATPGVNFDRETGQGTPFFYYTQGAAVAEVAIDPLTGQLTVPQVDLLIDIGNSINPGVDMGQITGGFIQGMGWVTAECLVYDELGALLSHSPTTYKIPAVTDIPEVFNCELFPNDTNEKNVARSKAVGEPPLMLAVAVWAAVKEALHAVAPQAAAALTLPATSEEILRCLSIERP